MQEEKIKHLDYLQDNIARMNRCSFHMKGLSITILSALLALYASGIGLYSKGNLLLLLVSLFPTIVFWAIDSYYLSKEKDLRLVYNAVAGLDDKKIVVRQFEIMPDIGKEKNIWLKTMFTGSEIGLYGSLILFIVIIIVIETARMEVL